MKTFFDKKSTVHYAPENFKMWSFKGLQIQIFIYYSILREINFGKIWISKIAIFTMSEAINFEFW